MHTNFADWVRAVHVEPTDDLIKKRWKAVEDIGAAFSKRDEIFELVRIYYSLAPKEPKLREKFVSLALAQDASYSKQDLENAILAGAVLQNIIKAKDKRSLGAALSVLTAHCEGLRTVKGVTSLIQNCRVYLLEEGKSKRPLPETYAPPKGGIQSGLAEKELRQLITENKGHIEIAERILSVFKKLEIDIKSQQEAAKQTSAHIFIQAEELNILWWLFGGYSRDRNESFSKISGADLCFVVAKELSDLTHFTPPPVASEAFLDKALSGKLEKDAQMSLEKFVAGINTAYISSVTIPANEEPLFPALCAVREFIEIGGDEGWKARVIKVASINLKGEITGLKWSIQVLNEITLRKVCDEWQ